MEFTFSFLFLVLLIISLFILSKLLLSPRNARLPPGPTPLPIIGNLLHLDGQLHHSLARLAKVHGPVMSIKLGLTTAIVISSPDAAQEVLKTKDAFFADRPIPDSFHALNHCDTSLLWLPSTSPLWRHFRTICGRYLFSVRYMETTGEIRAKKAGEIVEHFRRNAGRPVFIGRVMFRGMLNMISNLVFSQDVVDINSESAQEFKELVKGLMNEVVNASVSDYFPFLRLVDLQGRRRTSAGYLSRFYNFFDNMIDIRIKQSNNSGTKNGDFLDCLLDLCSESKISRREIQTLLTEIFVAATDTTSITVEWAMGELLHDPVAMAKVRAEVRETFASTALAEPETVKLPYLQAVVKEAMRLHPAGPLLGPHKAMEAGLDICGYAVPKGARVIVNAWAIGRDPEVWHESDLFKPERFLEKEFSFQGRDLEFIPFGSGRRICPGLPFATRVVPFLLALMLRDFDWRLPDGMEPKDVDLTEKFASTLDLAAPLCAVPIPVLN